MLSIFERHVAVGAPRQIGAEADSLQQSAARSARQRIPDQQVSAVLHPRGDFRLPLLVGGRGEIVDHEQAGMAEKIVVQAIAL